jgi:hypothetical protein
MITLYRIGSAIVAILCTSLFVNGPSGATSPDTVSHGEQTWRSGPGGFTLL